MLNRFIKISLISIAFASSTVIAEEASDKNIEVESIVVSEATKAKIQELTAECELPLSPTIPDGFLASQDEMLSAKKAMITFQANLQEYRTCINKVTLSFDAKSEKNHENLQAIKDLYNASVDSETATAEQFNKSVRAFNERNVSK